MISIIVPVYNVEKYLPKCIDSVLTQTYKDWELILVDDGSLDSSPLICDEYARKDNRIKVLHITNGGPSNARNQGIKVSAGEYLCFMDSDDWAEETYLEHLYEGLHEGVGLVVSGHKYQDRDDSDDCKIRCVGQNFLGTAKMRDFYGVADMHEILPSLMSFGFPHGKLYQTATVKSHNMEFPPNVWFCEDVIFLLRYLYHVEWVSFIPETDYHYMFSKGETSLIQRFNSPDSEYECYRISKSCYEKLYERFGFNEQEMLPSKEWTSFLLWRSIRTLYDKGERKLSRKESICFLKTLKDTDLSLLTIYTSWILKKNMMPIRLLQKHWFALADFWFYNVARIGMLLKH